MAYTDPAQMRAQAQRYRDLARQEHDEKVVSQLQKLASALDENADAREALAILLGNADKIADVGLAQA